MYSLSNIFSPKYWFSPSPVLSSLTLWIMIGIFSLMLVGAIVLLVLNKKRQFNQFFKHGLGKIASLLGWLGAAGFVLLFFRYELVPVLSLRLMYGLWLVGLLVWLVFVLRYWLMEMPKRRREQREQERLNKYLP